jgi:Minor capsid protein
MIKFDIGGIDLSGVEGDIEFAFKKGQYMLDNQVLKDSNYYAPQDQRFLIKSSILHSDLGNGKIVWQTPYAKRLYYNPQYNFSKDKNPNARGLWFEYAKMYAPNWAKITQETIRQHL